MIEALKTVYDPEIPVNIFEMGLMDDVLVDASGQVGVKMTLTAPACPAAQSLPVEVRDKARSVEGVTDAKVEVVWDPPWTKDRMSDAAKLQWECLGQDLKTRDPKTSRLKRHNPCMRALALVALFAGLSGPAWAQDRPPPPSTPDH